MTFHLLKSTGKQFGAVGGSLPLLLSIRVGSLINPSALVTYEECDDDSTSKNIIDLLGILIYNKYIYISTVINEMY